MRVPPVLVLGFNRVEESRTLYSRLQLIQPPDLFVAIDGPRVGTPGDKELCARVAEIFSNPDWNCNLRLRIRSENMGCSPAVIDAVTWFFNQVENGIVFEDDCLPDVSFFRYAAELLDRYRHNPRVMNISGDFFLGDKHERTDSYFPSRYGHTLGWASWSNAWQKFDCEMLDWAVRRDTDWLLGVCNQDPSATRYWRKVFDGSIDGRGIEWDAQWLYSIWKADGFSMVPTRNLVLHTGVGLDATHTKRTGWVERLPLESLDFPLKHPLGLEIDVVADRLTEKYVFVVDPTFWQYVAYFSRNPVQLFKRIRVALRNRAIRSFV